MARLHQTCRSRPSWPRDPSGPLHRRWHGRQNRIHIAAGLEPESGATIVEQVEFDIAATTYQLLVALGFGPGLLEIPAHKLGVDVDEGFAHGAGESEIRIPIAG